MYISPAWSITQMFWAGFWTITCKTYIFACYQPGPSFAGFGQDSRLLRIGGAPVHVTVVGDHSLVLGRILDHCI